MTVVLAGLATLISAAFAADLARQYLERRGSHAGLWAISLTLFAVACAMVAVGVSVGWSPTVYGLFWFAGALVTVPLLAVGQLLLLDPRRRAVWLSAGVVVIMASALAVTVSSMDAAALRSADARGGIPVGREVWGSSPATALLAPLNWSGLIVVVACIWSAIRARRVRLLLIALGVMVAGASFGFVRAGNPSIFTMMLTAGVALMYAGFRAASPRAGSAPPASTPSASTPSASSPSEASTALGTAAGSRMPEVVVYTRRGCTLCEAAELLAQRVTAGRATLRIVDIDHAPELYERYTVRVPVVAVDGRDVAELEIHEDDLRAVLDRTGAHAGRQ